MVTPEGNELEYAIKFWLKATNNEAEYKIVLNELHLARTLGAKRVKVNRDSNLW